MATDRVDPKTRRLMDAATARRALNGHETPLEGPTAGVMALPAVNLPEAFWSARAWLQHVRRAAHARATPADAVLTFVLARMCARIPYTVRLPDLVGSAGSLNFFAVVIGPPGAGKSTSKAVAAELVPLDDPTIGDDLPIGSGEGLIESFFETEELPPRRKVQVRTSAFVYVDEGAAVADLRQRQGSTLMATLRTAWTGGTLGQTNASAETRRKLPEHGYRLALVLAAQYPIAARMLDDVDLGGPQRYDWAAAIDPAIPDTPPAWPGPLDLPVPCRTSTHGIVVPSMMTIDAAVRAEVQAERLDVVRGAVVLPALDAHANLSRLKVAGILAAADDRRTITADDWALAGIYRDTSCGLRAAVIEHSARADTAAATRRNRAKAAEAVAVDERREQRALERLARQMGRHADRHAREGGECDRRCLARATAGRDRELASLDDALEYALAADWLRRVGEQYLPGGSRPA